MALVGKLEDVPTAEILQFLAMSEKTGKLSLTTGSEEGLIVFRRGRIIYAASSSVQETFGSIVTGLGLVTESHLVDALRRQHRSQEEKRLGTILVEMGVLSRSVLEDAMRHQVMRVLRETFGWERGFFKFRSLDIDDCGEVEVDARNLLLEHPLDTRQVTLDAARSEDEDAHRRGETRARPEPATLQDLIGEVAAPTVTAEAVRTVLAEVGAVLARAVVLVVQGPFVNGIAQLGLAEGAEPPAQRVRSLRLPLDEPSVVSQAIARRRPWRGRLVSNRWNLALAERLGEPMPQEVVVIPILTDRGVLLVIYGDNAEAPLPVTDLNALERKLAGMGRSLAPTRSGKRADVPASLPV